jgi:hypothetical protein
MVWFKFDFSGEASPRNRLVREHRADYIFVFFIGRIFS